MSNKGKGMNAERDLVHKFWSTRKWCAVRVAGSGSMKYPGPDLVVSNKIRTLAIECKSTKSKNKYLSKACVEQLKDFCNIFGAEPWFAIRFARNDWLFLSLDELEETESGFVISIELARRKGVVIDELTQEM